ncbi:thiamine phosphate synthase [Leekyejoonella antrihumi]|uniref:Thiamine phosphate synthase n=1 Tax=Leekyejoonella antrihumi TaxID=1660198 RepID=A0A563E237_9MICO|nr:thiamine phosphate synthase [Leekyejoonella antrihumi]TWP36349.1 thiamine phosphate synthase [Leekyejoonella antrihumi]
MTRVRAPRLLVITDRSQLPAGRSLESTLAECLSAGARHVLLRERDLPDDEHRSIVRRLLRLLTPVGGTLAVAAPLMPCAGVGLHLRASDPLPGVRPTMLGRSVHSLAEARAAASERCDYVTLSPVRATASKPGYGPPLGAAGIARVRRLVTGCPPILALGGVEPSDVFDVCAAGAHGVAVMGGIMRSPDPATTTARLLVALTSAFAELAPA